MYVFDLSNLLAFNRTMWKGKIHVVDPKYLGLLAFPAAAVVYSSQNNVDINELKKLPPSAHL